MYCSNCVREGALKDVRSTQRVILWDLLCFESYIHILEHYRKVVDYHAGSLIAGIEG